MFIRSRDEALDALAEVVALPERREQIIRCTVAIMQCLDPEARVLMTRCQALLIEGGLEELKQRRREAFETELVAVVDPEEDRELEAVASAQDALRFADVVQAAFPGLAPPFQPWEIARALLAQEADLREEIRIALVHRHDGASAEFAAAQIRAEAIVRRHLPEWRARAGEILRACRDVVKSSGGNGDAEIIFAAIAASDDRARPFLNQLDRDPSGAVETVRKLSEWTETVRTIEERKG
jgi:predicted protein tyrosine phosphatase